MSPDPYPLTAALLTRPGRSAVASVRIAGSAAKECIDHYFRSASGVGANSMSTDRVYFGRWGDGDEGEELVVARVAEHCFEVHCHGGALAAGRILEDVARRAGQVVEVADRMPGEAQDLLLREAMIALAQAPTDRIAAHLLTQVRGALHHRLGQLCRQVEQLAVDHGGNGREASAAEQVESQLQQLVAHGSLGVRLLRPFQVVIAGAPNVGKSVLLNRLVGYDRAIVFDQPGTTRDLLKTTTAWDGWLVQLTDTAGIRETTSDPIEQAGIESARQQIQAADLVLYVVDATDSGTWVLPSTPDASIQESNKCLRVANKCDLPHQPDQLPRDTICISAKTGDGVDLLVSDMLTSLTFPLDDDVPLPFLPRHQDLLTEALAQLREQRWSACAASLQAIIDGPLPANQPNDGGRS